MSKDNIENKLTRFLQNISGRKPFISLPQEFKAPISNVDTASTSVSIEDSQRALAKLGFPIGDAGLRSDGVDGVLGEKTRGAVKAFQIISREMPTGDLTVDIFVKLQKAVDSGFTFRELAKEANEQGIGLAIAVHFNKADFVNAIYFNAVLDEAISRIPAAVTTAQAILETSYGKTVPMDIVSGRYSYNLFGMKGEGPVGSVQSWDKEINRQTGALEPVLAQFQAYNSFGESMKEHSLLFINSTRYQAAYDTNNPADFARAIAKAGYAVDSRYAEKLIGIMKDWGLK